MVKKKEPENKFSLGKIEDIGPTREKKMKEHGLNYIQDICMSSPQDIARITGLDLGPCEKLFRNSRKTLEGMKIIRPMEMKASELYKYKKNLPRLKTNCLAIDYLFGGGIKSETLTEVYGAFGSGKTQLIMSVIVEALHDGHNVVMVDCEDTFDPERLLNMSVAKGYYSTEEEASKLLDNLTIESATSSVEVMDVLNNLTKTMIEKNIKLVAVDGALGLYRNEFHGRGELSVRQDYLKPLMERLGKLPLFFSCWVIMTNQVQSDPGVFFGDPTKPIGGNIVGHQATYRLYVRNLSKTKWQATMVDSPHHAKQDVLFQLTAKGPDDMEDEKKRIEKILSIAKGEPQPDVKRTDLLDDL